MPGRLISNNESVVIYDWLWGKYLILEIIPNASLIAAEVGHSVEQVLSMLPGNATAFVYHINCSQTERFPLSRPQLSGALKERGIEILNDAVTDISKNHLHGVSSRLGLNCPRASRQGDQEELIFIKTNWNSGGASEHLLNGRQRAQLGVGKGHPRMRHPKQYVVLPRKNVDPSWWEDPDLTCERYVTNRENRWYRAFVFRSRLAMAELINPDAVKKVGGSTVRHMWRLTSAGGARIESADNGFPKTMASEILLFKENFGLDFGAIDLVQDDSGRSYIVDVNTTPAFTVTIPGVVHHLRRDVSL